MGYFAVRQPGKTELKFSSVQLAFTEGKAKEQNLQSVQRRQIDYPAAFYADEETGQYYGPILRP